MIGLTHRAVLSERLTWPTDVLLGCEALIRSMKTGETLEVSSREEFRRKGSHWSESNKERALRMLYEGKMTESGLELLPEDILREWESKDARKRSA